MYGLDNSSGVNVMPKIAPVNSTAPLWFTEGGAGLGATYPGQDWFNQIQAELLNVLTKAGVKPEKGKLNQLAEAIGKIVNSGNFATTVALKDGLDEKINTTALVQNTGYNQYSIMSQKTVTEELNKKQDSGNFATTVALKDGLDKKINTTALVQSTGYNQYSIMSQKVATEALDNKVNYSAIVQATGQNQYSIMSQKTVTDSLFGVAQVWKDVLSERSSGTTYTNSSSKPISVSITQIGGKEITLEITVDNVVISRPSSAGVSRCFITFVVPAGSTYKVVSTGSEIINWAELR